MKILSSIKEEISYLLFSFSLKIKVINFNAGTEWVNQLLASGVPAEEILLYLDNKTAPDSFDLGAYYQLTLNNGDTDASS